MFLKLKRKILVFLVHSIWRLLNHRSVFLFLFQLVLLLFVLRTSVFATNSVSLWDEGTQTIDDVYLTLEYPQSWVEFSYKSPGVDYVLKTRDVVWPSHYNGVNTTSAFYIWRYGGRTERDAVQHVLEEPNRAGHAVFSYIEDYKGRNLSGKLIISHFGKYFGIRNGVRYDLVAYSMKRKQFYGFTLLIQYVKGSQDFTKEYNIQAYAYKIFEHIVLKN